MDDDELTLLAHQSALVAAGFEVETAEEGEAAIARVNEGFDCILSDIHMPGMDGLELLRRVRERDLDVPVILVTGEPSLETAMRALEYGALRYLTKPVASRELTGAVMEGVRIRALTRVKRDALAMMGGHAAMAGDRAGQEAAFARVLESLWMAVQPIVHARESRVFACEALLRSEVPALPDPGSVISAAEQLGQVHVLGRTVRARVADIIPAAPGDQSFFVNLHAADLLDDALYDAGAPLARFASRVVLEITERAPIEGIADLRERAARLRKLGYRLAIDDFGAGYSGLTILTRLEPEIVKLDMALVRGVDVSTVRQKVVARMTELAHDLGLAVVAEGVETAGERDVLAGIGCDYLQGFLFSRPARPFPEVSW